LAWVLTQHISPDSLRVEVIDGITVYRVGVVGLWRRVTRHLRRASAVDFQTSYEKALRRRGIRRLFHWLKQSCIQAFLALQAIAFLWRRRRSISTLLCFFFSPLEAIVCSWARRFGIPVIVRSATSRDYLFHDLVGRWQKESLLQADRVVAISEDIRKELLALGVEDYRIRMIPNGVDVPKEEWKADAHHRYGAVCIANFSQQPLKGLDVLVEAWAIVVAKAHGPVHLVICGRGNATSLIQLAQRHGIRELIEFRGSVHDVTSILLQSDVFVLPSRVEGMSNALLEAMALGMPCVATSVSGSADLIDSGRNGVLVPVENPGALAGAIVDVLSNPAMQVRIGLEARRTIERAYTTEVMARKYKALLEELSPDVSKPR